MQFDTVKLKQFTKLVLNDDDIKNKKIRMVRLYLIILDKNDPCSLGTILFKDKERIIDMNTQWVSSVDKTRALQTHVCTMFLLINFLVFSVLSVSLMDSILFRKF